MFRQDLPRCGIIIAHHNYSDHIGQCLRSVVSQTHERFECVIVDDASTENEYSRLQASVKDINDSRIRLIQNKQNIGQVPSFFRGLDETRAEFVCLLDPDDCYASDFLEKMLKAHLNRYVYAPIACCDQALRRAGGDVLTQTIIHNRIGGPGDSGGEPIHRSGDCAADNLTYFAPDCTGWYWTSTSSLVFRRDAVNLLRPHRKLEYCDNADSYLSLANHMMGGTLFLEEPLLYRGIHNKNAWYKEQVISVYQNDQRKGAVNLAAKAKMDAIEAFFSNNGDELFPSENIIGVLRLHFSSDELEKINQFSPRINLTSPD